MSGEEGHGKLSQQKGSGVVEHPAGDGSTPTGTSAASTNTVRSKQRSTTSLDIVGVGDERGLKKHDALNDENATATTKLKRETLFGTLRKSPKSGRNQSFFSPLAQPRTEHQRERPATFVPVRDASGELEVFYRRMHSLDNEQRKAVMLAVKDGLSIEEALELAKSFLNQTCIEDEE